MPANHEIVNSVVQRSGEQETGFSRSQRDRYYIRNQRNPNQDFDILRWNLTKVEQFMYLVNPHYANTFDAQIPPRGSGN